MGQSDVKPVTIGVDLGGTKVEMGLINSQGQVLAGNRYPTHPEKGSEGIIANIVDVANRLQRKSGCKAQALGIGVAGQVDLEGIIKSAPNLPFQNEPLQLKLEKKLARPVVVTNDVRAATLGEWHYGAGKGVDDLVVIFVGTGIGGGIVSGGKLLMGCTNTFGELGHITLVAEGRKCRCPNQGCLEAYSGGWAIAERAREAVSANPEKGKKLKSLAGGIESISAATVTKAYHESDPLAKNVVEKTCQYLAAGVVGIINAFNPCLLVLGGGVIEGMPELIQIVEEIVKKRVLQSNAEKLSIVKAALGGKAGVIGAATLARNIVQ